jgi:hypothetical protein
MLLYYQFIYFKRLSDGDSKSDNGVKGGPDDMGVMKDTNDDRKNLQEQLQNELDKYIFDMTSNC